MAEVLALAAARPAVKVLILHIAASRVGAMDVGAFTSGGLAAALDGAATVWNLGADEVDVPAGPFVIYQGSHGDRGAHRADLILPAAAWTEEDGLFVNTEGRPQLALRAAFPPGEAKENWAILRAVSAAAGRTQGWDSLAGLRRAMLAAHPHLGRVDEVAENRLPAPLPGTLGSGAFASPVRAQYLEQPDPAGEPHHGRAGADRGRARRPGAGGGVRGAAWAVALALAAAARGRAAVRPRLSGHRDGAARRGSRELLRRHAGGPGRSDVERYAPAPRRSMRSSGATASPATSALWWMNRLESGAAMLSIPSRRRCPAARGRSTPRRRSPTAPRTGFRRSEGARCRHSSTTMASGSSS